MGKQALCSIEWTLAGPIIIKEVSPEELKTLRKQGKATRRQRRELIKSFYTFDEAKSIVCNWFRQRTTTIAMMTEEEYFRTSPLEPVPDNTFKDTQLDGEHRCLSAHDVDST
jgi:hypothetical protein